MSYQQHQQTSSPIMARCAVITLSDTRTAETDTSGRSIRDHLTSAGHEVTAYHLCKDDPAELDPLLSQLLTRTDVDAILTNGGTGIARRDQTISVVERIVDLPLPGFGELFRMLSWQQIGPGAMLSRAMAGISCGKLIFSMPGSTKAVDLAMTELILPELRHLLHELRK